MGICHSDIPIDTSGQNADRWHFKMTEPFTGAHFSTQMDEGRTTEPVTGFIMRRIAGGMGHAIIGAVRVGGGEHMEVGDCAWFAPAPVAAAAPTADEQEEAEFAALLAAEQAAKAQASIPAAAPAPDLSNPETGAAVLSADTEPATPKAKAKQK